MNVLALIFESLIAPAGVYLLCLLIFQRLALQYLQFRYSGATGMSAFLSRYTRFKRIIFEENESVSLAYIQRKHAHAWGMMGIGMVAIFFSWQSISKNEFNWFLIVSSFSVPSLDGFFRASSFFAATCFSELGVASFSENNEKNKG